MVIYPWQQTKHGQECFDNFGSTDSSRPLPLPSFIHFPLPAELLPMLTVAATFLGYTTNNTNRKQKQKQQKQNKKQQQKAHRKWWGEKNKQKQNKKHHLLSLSTSMQRTQCLRQHAKNGYQHDTWILDQVMA